MRLGRWLPVVVEAGGGLVLFALVLKLGFLTGLMRLDYYDPGVYRHYGEATTAGRVPYRDFDVEYLPGSLPFFIFPALCVVIMGPIWPTLAGTNAAGV